jgi:glutamate 5-kinase
MTKLVFRIEIASLLGETGLIDQKKLGRLAMLCTDLSNGGFKISIVSSGAIVLGSAKLGLSKPPEALNQKQAAAAVGMAELIRIYQNAFDELKQMVAQVLLTTDDFGNGKRRQNAMNTLENLMEKGMIPVINENDSVSIEDIVLGDNYPLALNVASLTQSELIIIKYINDEQYLILDGFDGSSSEGGEEDIFIAAERCAERLSRHEKCSGLFPASLNELSFNQAK